ncbi:MAG: cysW, partial [Planctomycetaceae bacterium]|nr:cysW [Planctomycetaceae bacterium]
MHAKGSSLMAPKNCQTGRHAHTEPAWVRYLLITSAVLIMAVLVVIPVVNVFYQALEDGVGTYWKQLVQDPNTRH